MGGDHAYAYKGHSNYDDYGNDSDQLCRTVIFDKDGRRKTVVGCSPYDTESYVVETEITERIRTGSPMITSDYRYGSPKKLEPVRNYGSYGDHDTYRRPSSPYHDGGRHPQEIDRFLTGVQVEASRPSPHRYSPSTGHGVANIRPTTHSVGVTPGHGGGLYKKDHDYHHKSSGYGSGDYSSDDEEDYEREEDYYKPGRTISVQPVGKHSIYDRGHGRKATIGEGSYGSPVSTHGHHASAGVPLSMPTNSIEEAVHYLKSSAISSDVKPYVHQPNTGHYTEAATPYGAYGTTMNKPTAASTYTRGSTTTTGSSHGAVMDCYEAARRFNGKVVRT